MSKQDMNIPQQRLVDLYGEPCNTLFITQLPMSMTKDKLMEMLRPVGEPLFVKFHTKRNKDFGGVAFAVYNSATQAEQALRNIIDAGLINQFFKVKFSKDPTFDYKQRESTYQTNVEYQDYFKHERLRFGKTKGMKRERLVTPMDFDKKYQKSRFMDLSQSDYPKLYMRKSLDIHGLEEEAQREEAEKHKKKIEEEKKKNYEDLDKKYEKPDRYEVNDKKPDDIDRYEDRHRSRRNSHHDRRDYHERRSDRRDYSPSKSEYGEHPYPMQYQRYQDDAYQQMMMLGQMQQMLSAMQYMAMQNSQSMPPYQYMSPPAHQPEQNY